MLTDVRLQAIGYATPYMVDDKPGSAGLGPKVFFVWGGVSVLAVIFVYLCVESSLAPFPSAPCPGPPLCAPAFQTLSH